MGTGQMVQTRTSPRQNELGQGLCCQCDITDAISPVCPAPEHGTQHRGEDKVALSWEPQLDGLPVTL